MGKRWEATKDFCWRVVGRRPPPPGPPPASIASASAIPERQPPPEPPLPLQQPTPHLARTDVAAPPPPAPAALAPPTPRAAPEEPTATEVQLWRRQLVPRAVAEALGAATPGRPGPEHADLRRVAVLQRLVLVARSDQRASASPADRDRRGCPIWPAWVLALVDAEIAEWRRAHAG